MQLEETEKDGVRAKCIPRKPKSMLASKKESNFIINSSNNGSSNGQQGGSKRLEAQAIAVDRHCKLQCLGKREAQAKYAAAKTLANFQSRHNDANIEEEEEHGVQEFDVGM